jgi:hypothetical protein
VTPKGVLISEVVTHFDHAVFRGFTVTGIQLIWSTYGMLGIAKSIKQIKLK